jgi:hypothetical protein
MFARWSSFKLAGLCTFILALSPTIANQHVSPICTQDEASRDIISEDFVKNRPAKPKSNTVGVVKRPCTYRLATTPTKQIDRSRLQVGVTIWKLEPVAGKQSIYGSDRDRLEWIPRRVEADAQFREGDSLRLSIESPRAGYLYVVDRDRLVDGTFGETNLIFPTQGEDNRLEPGKLIDIPGQDDRPFTATPKANQSGELLTFVVTSAPLPLALSKRPLPISNTQLRAWEDKWRAEVDRFELKGGAGQTRTEQEQLAAAGTGSRQLTREDPLPQSIYSLIPKNNDALLFSIVLSYIR